MALLKRPLSFEIHTPVDSSGWDVNLALEEQFGKYCLLGIYPFNKRHFWVTAKNLEFAEKFRERGSFLLSDQKVCLDPVDEPFLTMTIRDCPLEVEPEHLVQALAPYGVVLEHKYVAYDQRPSLLMGVRRLKFRLGVKSEPVPSLLWVSGFKVQVTYPGMVLRCGGNSLATKVTT